MCASFMHPLKHKSRPATINVKKKKKKKEEMQCADIFGYNVLRDSKIST